MNPGWMTGIRQPEIQGIIWKWWMARAEDRDYPKNMGPTWWRKQTEMLHHSSAYLYSFPHPTPESKWANSYQFICFKSSFCINFYFNSTSSTFSLTSWVGHFFSSFDHFFLATFSRFLEFTSTNHPSTPSESIVSSTHHPSFIFIFTCLFISLSNP